MPEGWTEDLPDWPENQPSSRPDSVGDDDDDDED
jgi:hypothetical protein